MTDYSPFITGGPPSAKRAGTRSDQSVAGVPGSFIIHQNRPNPFNASTIISFSLPQGSKVELAVFNMLGQRVNTLVDGFLPAGHHEVPWDGVDHYGRSVASGVYLYRISANNKQEIRKMVLLK